VVINKIGEIGPFVNSMVIFDRDGTLSEDLGAMSGNSSCIILPHVFKGLRMILNSQTSFAIATNQSYIGRGELTMKDVNDFNAKLMNALKSIGMEVNFIAICPHRSDENCNCRKPKPGMINELVRLSGVLDKNRVFFVGDKDSDEQAACNAGVRGVNLQRVDFVGACKQIKNDLTQF
jgi:D-glycero-D-manno-heptose 1,7-bisphosphate phosphatase